jgi:hypothetical protein
MILIITDVEEMGMTFFASFNESLILIRFKLILLTSILYGVPSFPYNVLLHQWEVSYIPRKYCLEGSKL